MTAHRDPQRQAAIVLANKLMATALLAGVVAFLLVWWLFPEVVTAFMRGRP